MVSGSPFASGKKGCNDQFNFVVTYCCQSLVMHFLVIIVIPSSQKIHSFSCKYCRKIHSNIKTLLKVIIFWMGPKYAINSHHPSGEATNQNTLVVLPWKKKKLHLLWIIVAPAYFYLIWLLFFNLIFVILFLLSSVFFYHIPGLFFSCSEIIFK